MRGEKDRLNNNNNVDNQNNADNQGNANNQDILDNVPNANVVIGLPRVGIKWKEPNSLWSKKNQIRY